MKDLSEISLDEIVRIIRPCGSFSKKSMYVSEVAKSLILNHNGSVPNDRNYLESLPGVGRKTANVVLKNLFNEQAIPVDTHVERVSKRLGFAKEDDDALTIEKKLMKLIPHESWNKVSEQILLFGRYYCTSKKPKCEDCKLKQYCKMKK